MKKLIILLIGMVMSTAAFSEEVVVIVNAANGQSLSSADIKGIYSDNVTNWANGNRIKSFDLPVKASARQMFSESVLGMSAKSAAKAWANRKITNTAKNPPKTKKDKLVVSNVAKNGNAIGYVPKSLADGAEGIKVILTIN